MRFGFWNIGLGGFRRSGFFVWGWRHGGFEPRGFRRWGFGFRNNGFCVADFAVFWSSRFHVLGCKIWSFAHSSLRVSDLVVSDFGIFYVAAYDIAVLDSAVRVLEFWTMGFEV